MSVSSYLLDANRTCDGFTQCVPDVVEEWGVPSLFSVAGKVVRTSSSPFGALAQAGDAIGTLLETPAIGGIGHFVGAVGMFSYGKSLVSTAGLSLKCRWSNGGIPLSTPYITWETGRGFQALKGTGIICASLYLGVYPSMRSLAGWDWQQVV